MHSSSTSTYLVKDVLELVLRQGRTFHVLDRTKVLRHFLTILPANRLHLLLAKLVTHRGVVTQIDLSADDEAGHARAVVMDFGKPLLANVLE